MSGPRRVMLVGWDAADWKMIHPLMDAGYMPTVKRLVETGVMGNLATLSPILSPILWSSIATGKRPFKHGVHGFTEPTPDGKAVRPVTSMSRTTRAIWNILTLQGMRSHVVGWWPSHPAEPISGVMVSNQYQRAPRDPKAPWPMPAGTVHPERLAETLAELRLHPSELGEEHVRLFVPQGHKIDQDRDRRLDSILRILADCTSIHAAATHLIAEEPWDFAGIYYDAIDHFGHGFMKYHPPKQEIVAEADFEIYKQVVSAGYIYHDMMLARLIELAGEETVVMLVSDHGFHPDHLRPQAMPLEPAGPAIEHRDQGIFLMAGPGIKRDHLVTGASLLDIAPTVLALFGLPVGEDMDGRPLLDCFESPPEIRTLPSWDAVEGEAGRHPAGAEADPDQARETLRQLVALGYIEKPDDDAEKAVAQTVREQRYNLALAYMDAGRHPAAAEILAELYRAYPLEFRFGIRLALCLQAMQRPDEMARVLDHLNENWRRASERARARLAEIRALLQARRRARAEAAPEEAAQAADDAAEAVIAAAEAQAEAEDEDAPPAPGRPQLMTEPERRVVRTLRGIARGNARTLDYLAASVATARRDHAAALAHLERAREGETEAPGFHIQLGNAYVELKRLPEAGACFERALALDPENPNAHLGLARIALKERRPADALAAARAAVALKYQFPPAHFFLGLAQARSGRVADGIASLERAIAQNPNFPEAHVALAQIHRRMMGDVVRATRHRMEARAIRAARRESRAERPAVALPELERIDLDAELPVWPKPPEHLVPPLAAAPVPRPERLPERPGAPFVTVVSGLPRSGTSMAMQMLVAGGLAPMTDAERGPDESNPRGYLELERVKRLATENDWLDEARGKALKVVTPLLPALAQHCDYRVILMERDLDEILASQDRMLERLAREGADLDRERLKQALAQQTARARALLDAHAVPHLTLSHRETLADPAAAAARMAEFLGLDLDTAAMAASVDPALWRERTG